MAEIFDRFVDLGILNSCHLDLVKVYAEKWGKTLFHSILECHILTESALADTLSEVLKLERVMEIDVSKVDVKLLSTFSLEAAMRLECLPFFKEAEVVPLVVADPTRSDLLSFAEKQLSTPVRYLVTERGQLSQIILESFPIIDELST